MSFAKIILLDEFHRFNGKILKPLEAHSAADAQTGAIGDIEIVNADGSAFEAIEVKHGLTITTAIVDSAKQKICGSQVERYYILTTHSQHEPDSEVIKEVENVKKLEEDEAIGFEHRDIWNKIATGIIALDGN